MVRLAAFSLALVVFGLVLEHQVDAVPTATSMYSCARDYVVGLVRDKLINKSTLAASFNDAMARARARYAEAEANGELEGKDDADCSSIRYKLVIEELRKLRASYETGQIKVDNQEGPEDKLIASCVNVSNNVDKNAWTPDVPTDKDDEDRELELLSQLDDLEHQASSEDEMGLSLSPEVRDQLKTRTKVVLTDLLNNEIRQLALSVVTAYMAGGPIAGVLSAVSGSLKFKIIEFLMNGAMDVLSSLMGRPIERTPVELLRPSPYEEISADDLVAKAKLAT